MVAINICIIAAVHCENQTPHATRWTPSSTWPPPTAPPRVRSSHPTAPPSWTRWSSLTTRTKKDHFNFEALWNVSTTFLWLDMFVAIPCRNIYKAQIKKENLSKSVNICNLKTFDCSTLLSVMHLISTPYLLGADYNFQSRRQLWRREGYIYNCQNALKISHGKILIWSASVKISWLTVFYHIFLKDHQGVVRLDRGDKMGGK